MKTLLFPGFARLATYLAALAVLIPAASRAAAVDHGLLQPEFPFQGACISAPSPKGNIALKGLAIRVGPKASVLFDTELLRMAAGWTGGYITTTGVAFDGGHGDHPAIDGPQQFGCANVPGWIGEKDAFKDPRREPYGALPQDQAHWIGLAVNGMDVCLHYSVRGADILEQPGSRFVEGLTGFTRTFQVDHPAENLTLLVCDVTDAVPVMNADGTTLILKTGGGNQTRVGVAGLPAGGRLEVADGRVVVRVPKSTGSHFFTVAIWSGSDADGARFSGLLEGMPKMTDFKKGGSAHWPDEVITQGQLETSASPDGAYVTDNVTPPLMNPWHRRVRFGGMDFFSDGKRAALCTWDGDIWIVSGIDDTLENLHWRRFASGMYETLGLKIIDDVIYTSGRDQITRYRDLNGDGEADVYENVCNLYTSTEGFHEFVFDLQTDAAGNFYFAKAGPVQPGGRGFERIAAHNGTLCKVSKDGRTVEVIATGFRAPNGIGVGPNGQLTTGDNEGTWIPACPINWIKPGGFYGVEELAHRNPVPAFNPPLCWMSHNGWDNSGGGQVWVTSSQWGPYRGELLHTSYGECALYLVLKQAAGNLMQGGVVRIPVRFNSSAMRPRFNPVDGQLYVAGLLGWQSKAARTSGFDRVRYTGKPVVSVRELLVDKKGVHLTFTQPLNPKEAVDLQNYSVERWNYVRSANYGSPEVLPDNPKKAGHEKLEVNRVTLSQDGRTVTLEILGLKPVMQQQIKYTLTTAEGTLLRQDILHTIHTIP